ncbi:hypothetical protein BJX64DRAFT_293127 [Aspergillus heterothallicus]
MSYSVSTCRENEVTVSRYMGSYDAGSLDASSTVFVRNDNVSQYNLNIDGTYTSGKPVALTRIENQQRSYGCSFKSTKGTLYAKSGSKYYSIAISKEPFITSLEGRRRDIVDVNHRSTTNHELFTGTIASSGGYLTARSRSYDDDTTWDVAFEQIPSQ